MYLYKHPGIFVCKQEAKSLSPSQVPDVPPLPPLGASQNPIEQASSILAKKQLTQQRLTGVAVQVCVSGARGQIVALPDAIPKTKLGSLYHYDMSLHAANAIVDTALLCFFVPRACIALLSIHELYAF
jgi:hypothetical protein